MQISVEKVSNAERRLTISVPNQEIETEYQKQIQEVAKKANLQGFRPGKAPLTLIMKRYGEEVRRDAMSTVMRQALADAIKENQLQPINYPRIEPKAGKNANAFEFVAYIEVYPEIENLQFDMKEVEQLHVDVNDADIDQVIEQLKKQHTTWTDVSRPAVLKDRLIIDYYAIFEGKSDLENKVEKFTLELGSNVMIPGFEDGLVGVTAGEQKTLSLHFPADFQLTDKAGKPVDFVINVSKVYEGDIPQVNADFLKKLGVDSGNVDDLKSQIRSSLEQERDRLVKAKLKEQIFGYLIEHNNVDVPASLIQREAHAIHDEMYRYEHDHSNHSEEELSKFDEIAKKRVSLSLLLAELIKKYDLKVDQSLVEKRVSEIASLYQDSAEVIKWLTSDEQRQGIESQVLEDQVIAKLMENLNVIRKEMGYAELKGIQK